MLLRLARSRPDSTGRGRRVGFLLACVMLAMSVVFWPTGPVAAAPSDDQCQYKDWVNPAKVQNCINRLDRPTDDINDCMGVPIPSAPDSGFGGWFATDPKLGPGVQGQYSSFGYSGYSYALYDPGCVTGQSALPTDASTTTTIANGELMVATGIVGADNALRERAYDPGKMWSWADGLVKTATKAVYEKVFSVFGAITVAVVGLYLVWRSRQANLSDALTTAGWAVLVMVVVTAVAAWPLVSAHLADKTLLTGLGAVQSAVGPRTQDIPLSTCVYAKPGQPSWIDHDPALCKDHRPPALRASDTATQTVLYNNWLRGTVGSATSPTAKKYGLALYESSTLTWDEAHAVEPRASDTKAEAKQRAANRERLIRKKRTDFRAIAGQIQTEDPEAYSYLQGKQGPARMGAGLIAILSAVAFSFFDMAASLLIILGFLIFRWAVVAIPIIGTIAILRPASSGFKRLINIVVAAIFNIIIFGAGASVYLLAADLIMNTHTLPGWLQITLLALSGVVGWLLLRPYRRITQLRGKNSLAELVTIGTLHRRLVSDLRGVAAGAAGGAAVAEAVKADDDQDTTTQRTTTADTETTATDTTSAADTAPAESAAAGQDAADHPAAASDPTSPPSRATPASFSEPAGVSDNDDRVWVPATGRYAAGDTSYDELETTVRQADEDLTRSANSLSWERELDHR